MLAQARLDSAGLDPDELFLLISSGLACLFGIVYWARALRSVSRLGCHPLYRTPMYLACLIGFLVMALVIWRWADPQIRADFSYILLVVLMGGACLILACALLHWFGLGLRDDAFERRNLAAVLALSGAILGILITYSGAIVGEGPSFWNNVYSSVLATGALLACWLLVVSLGGAARSIGDHDLAAGLRLGILMVALSLILGRAVAGNWKSVAATNHDFIREAGPALILTLLAIAAEWFLRPSQRNPRPSASAAGLLPGLFYLLVAGLWVAHLGWWKGGQW